MGDVGRPCRQAMLRAINWQSLPPGQAVLKFSSSLGIASQSFGIGRLPFGIEAWSEKACLL